MTRQQLDEKADRAVRERIAAEYEERLDAARAGLCSFAAAEQGGALYLADLAETRRENEREAREQADYSDNPVWYAVRHWARAQAVAFDRAERSGHDTEEERRIA